MPSFKTLERQKFSSMPTVTGQRQASSGEVRNLRIVKICYLLEIHENQIFIVAHNSWHLLLGTIDGLDVTVDDRLQILAKLFFRFDEFTNDSSEMGTSKDAHQSISTSVMCIFRPTRVCKPHRRLCRQRSPTRCCSWCPKRRPEPIPPWRCRCRQRF